MTRNGIRVVDLLDDFETFVNKFTILADNHMATFPGLQVRFFCLWPDPCVIQSVSGINDQCQAESGFHFRLFFRHRME
jgi:hypothetical protein